MSGKIRGFRLPRDVLYLGIHAAARMITHRESGLKMHRQRRAIPAACFGLCAFSPALSAASAVAVGGGLTILILLVAAASAYLPLAACRYWKGAWRKAALAPLLLLLLWIVLALAHKAADPSAHPRWQLELFILAMGTMVYMVAVFTIKSIIDKSKR